MLASVAWWIVDLFWEYNVDLRREMGMVPSFTLVELAVSARTNIDFFEQMWEPSDCYLCCELLIVYY